jgi:hypothetical protein
MSRNTMVRIIEDGTRLYQKAKKAISVLTPMAL